MASAFIKEELKRVCEEEERLVDYIWGNDAMAKRMTQIIKQLEKELLVFAEREKSGIIRVKSQKTIRTRIQPG